MRSSPFRCARHRFLVQSTEVLPRKASVDWAHKVWTLEPCLSVKLHSETFQFYLKTGTAPSRNACWIIRIATNVATLAQNNQGSDVEHSPSNDAGDLLQYPNSFRPITWAHQMEAPRTNTSSHLNSSQTRRAFSTSITTYYKLSLHLDRTHTVVVHSFSSYVIPYRHTM